MDQEYYTVRPKTLAPVAISVLEDAIRTSSRLKEYVGSVWILSLVALFKIIDKENCQSLELGNKIP